MKKLTKASIEALKNEMPVLDKNELEAVKGGGTVYCSCGSGAIGWDGANNENLYVMGIDSFHKYQREHCGLYDVTIWGGVSLDKASEHHQSVYVRDIMQQANLLGNGASVEFVNDGSGGITAHYDSSDNLVYSISYGASALANKDKLLSALESAANSAYPSYGYCGMWNRLP